MRMTGASKAEDPEGRTFLLPQKAHATIFYFPTLRFLFEDHGAHLELVTFN